MPPATPASGGKLRRTLLAASLILLALSAYGFVELGAFLAREDTLQKADAILVLSGTPMRRPLEAADLYIEGFGSRIVLTRQTPEGGERALVERGVPFLEDVARARDAFIQLGIPAEAILVPDRIHDSTAAEAITLRELAERHGWHRVIVVSSKYHLRRAGFAFRRELRGTGVQLMMRGTRYDGLEPNRWWQRRRDVREIVPEVPKFLAYLFGLGA
ncbi:MAG: YdcF family protein [Acidobacteria bacterium]|nr:YdcF family protein [Acidobacteriota bacterium]